MKFEFETTEKWETCYKVNGEILIAANEYELVRLMAKKYYDQPSTNKQHRDRTKAMFKNWDGTQIDATSDESFVRSLLMCEWIKVLPEQSNALRSAENGSGRDVSGTICNAIVLVSSSYLFGRFFVGLTLGI